MKNNKTQQPENNDEKLQELIKEKHLLIKKELHGLSLWQAKHVLKCVEEDLEGLAIIHSVPFTIDTEKIWNQLISETSNSNSIIETT